MTMPRANLRTDDAGMRRRTVVRTLAPILIVMSVWVALFLVLDLGWLPNDDGSLAETAEMVRSGEVPHLDFDAPYTGLQSYLDAFALEAFGDNLLSLRYPLWILSGVWMLALFALAKRVLDPIESALAAVAIALMSIFTHLSPVPSWYLLILGTLATWCSVKYLEGDSRVWLVCAGFFVGLATLFKSTGLVFAMAIGLTLAVKAVRHGSKTERRFGASVIVGAITLSALLVSQAPSLGRYLLLVVPLALIGAGEWAREPDPRLPSGGDASLTREAILVAAGMAVPLTLFGYAFWRAGALIPLWHAVLATPSLVIADLARDVGNPAISVVAMGFALLVWRMSTWDRRRRLIGSTVGLLMIMATYLLFPRTALLIAFAAVAWSGLVLVTAYLFQTSTRRSRSVPLSVAAVAVSGLSFTLIQFPASNLFYVMVSAPLTVLSILMLGRLKSMGLGRMILGCLLAIGGMFSIAKVEGRLFAWGPTGTVTRYVQLTMPRGNIKVPEFWSYYNELVTDISKLDSGNLTLLAGPDAPEIYFLAGIDNPTPILFDYLSVNNNGRGTLRYLDDLNPDVFINNLEPVSSSSIVSTSIPTTCSLVGRYGPLELYMHCAD